MGAETKTLNKMAGSGNEDLDRGGSGNDDLDRVSQTTQREQPERTGLPPTAEVHADHKGNLVNEYNQIVARAGKEARLYQDLHKTKGQAQTLQGQLQDVSGRFEKQWRSDKVYIAS